MQFDTTINKWHTAPNTGRINGSNPCSRVHAPRQLGLQPGQSINLLTFLDDDDRRSTWTGSGPRSRSSSPPRRSSSATPTTRRRRSPRTRGASASSASATPTSARCSWPRACPTTPTQGRAWAAAITALLTGHAYATSARTAARMGPFAGYHENVEPMLNVLRMHRDEVAAHRRGAWCRTELLSAAQEAWDPAVELGRAVRRAQLAGQRAGPDRDHRSADGLRHDRRRARPRAGQDQEAGRRRARCRSSTRRCPGPWPGWATAPDQVDDIVAYIDEHKSIVGRPAPGAGAPARVRLLDGGQHHPLPRPHPHDGRGPALHLAAPSPRRSTCPRT